MTHRRAISTGLLAVALALLLSGSIFAQTNGSYNALDFAYGIGGQPALSSSSSAAAGATTITLKYGRVTLLNGKIIAPITTTTPITIGIGSTRETVTPSAVSCSTPATYNTCQVTATWTYAHGANERIVSGTAGLQEAINYAHSQGGGSVAVGPAWFTQGGTETIIFAASPYYDVYVQGATAYSAQPTTLTSLAVPTTLDATSVTWTGTTGTWTAAAHYICVTYVDMLGGEGPCSATYNVTPAANTILHIASPAASTGAVGWRAYAGASYNAANLLPISSTSCTLTKLEGVVSACAIGSAGTWTAIFTTTNVLRPNAQTMVANLNLPMPQGHTTFGYRPTLHPQFFQQNYGPFPGVSLAAGEISQLASVNLPSGYLNRIGRTVKISGKLTSSSTNTATLPVVTTMIGWTGGTTAGAPIALCENTAPAALGSTAAWNIWFQCTLTTNAAGTGAASTIMASGTMSYALAAGTAAMTVVPDALAAAVGSLDLNRQDTLFVKYTSGTNTTTTVKVLELHVETLE